MYKSILLAALACLMHLSVEAQSLLEYSWKENPKLHTLTAKELEEPAYALLHRQSYEFSIDEAKGGLKQHSLTHRIIKVNTDNAIEQHNRIYIPLHNTDNIVQLKARSISPEGKITEVDRNNIKEIKEEEGSGAYRIFALEGVVKGSEIEYYYIEENSLSFFGRAYFQSNIPCKKAIFTLQSPSFIQYEVKSYNGFPTPTENLSAGGIRTITAEKTDLPALRKQEFANYNSNRQRVEYRLNKNLRYSTLPLFTWYDASKYVHEQLYKLSSKEEKQVQKLFKTIKVDQGLSQKEKIIRIENHLKTNFMIQKGLGSSDLEEVIKKGFGSEQGLVKLYAALFRQAGVVHELGLTSDRSNVRFDADFSCWNYLETYLFYFPELDQYLAPEDLRYRFPLVPYENTYNQGLFIKPAPANASLEPTHKIRTIPTPGHQANYHNMDIQVKLSPKMDKVMLQVNQKYGGYSAAYVQPAYAFMPKEAREEMVQSLIKFSAPDAQVEKYTISGGEPNLNLLEKAFIIDASLSSTALLEKAGNRYLLKVGQVIGPQSELYQEEARTLTVENDFNRMYDRIIKVELPEGYVFKNPEDIKMEKVFKRQQDKEPHCLFRSTYKQEGNLLTINIEEYYREIECDLENYEKFKEVINAAADFNKVTLVLEKSKGN